jgi:hypothetical protein
MSDDELPPLTHEQRRALDVGDFFVPRHRVRWWRIGSMCRTMSIACLGFMLGLQLDGDRCPMWARWALVIAAAAFSVVADGALRHAKGESA